VQHPTETSIPMSTRSETVSSHSMAPALRGRPVAVDPKAGIFGGE
jgi:hypothetical protein